MEFPMESYTQCPDNRHPHLIDLGLPSGTKWACCNIRAKSPEEYGGYYAWGETTTKYEYSPLNYRLGYEHPNDDGTFSIWYYDIGSNIAGTQYDAAYMNWKGTWQMPTAEQLNELMVETSHEQTTINGINGYLFTGSNGGSIFLPAAGGFGNYSFDNYEVGKEGCYWSSSVNDNVNMYPSSLYFGPQFTNSPNWGYNDRYCGYSVRAVQAM